MRIEEFGLENKTTIVMLHGANFVHSFGKQYALANKYHIVVPHIMGFGNETDATFETDACVEQLAEYIKSLNKKVVLVGFSLGAQLAFKLVSEYEYLFSSAILVSPWLIKEEASMSHMVDVNLKQLRSLKKRWQCNIIGFMNGLISSSVRKEFVDQMQNVKEETIKNMVDNKITIDDVSNFANVTIPIIALAGEKESIDVIDSVIKLSQVNSNCRYEIWPKAKHNIPIMYACKFNKLICTFADKYN